MSYQYPASFVEQYSANLEHLLQQQDTRFAGKVRNETQRGKTRFFEQLGSVEAVQRTVRHGDTPRIDTPHRRRAVFMKDWEIADLIDEQDTIRSLIDAKSGYAKAFAMALARKKDDVIIQAMTGTSYADVDGSGATVPVELPATQKVAVNLGGANSGLTLAKMIEAKHILGENEVPIGSQLYLAIAQRQLTDLLNNVDQVNNSDYNSVRALIKGEVDEFMGFKFVKSQRLFKNTATDIRSCVAWWDQAVVFSTGLPAQGRISERDDKSYATQVYARMTCGATRLQEEGVVEIACDESP